MLKRPYIGITSVALISSSRTYFQNIIYDISSVFVHSQLHFNLFIQAFVLSHYFKQLSNFCPPLFLKEILCIANVANWNISADRFKATERYMRHFSILLAFKHFIGMNTWVMSDVITHDI